MKQEENTMSFLQMVSDAQKKKNHKVKIEIPNPDSEPIIAYLSPLKFQDLLRQNSVIKMQEYKYFMDNGGDVPINLEQWKRNTIQNQERLLNLRIENLIKENRQDEIDELKEKHQKDLQDILKNPPLNEAQIQADAMTTLRSSVEIIPYYLVDENDAPLLKNEEEITEFKKIVEQDLELRQILLEASNKLFELSQNKKEQAKNE